MANSKAYFSFVLLFAFLISSHVLTHELPEGHKHSYNDKRNNFNHPRLSQDLVEDWRQGSIDVEERIPSHNGEVHELEGSTSGSIGYYPIQWFQWPLPPIHHPNPSPFPRPLPMPPTAQRDYNAHSVGYQPSGLKDIELKNCEDRSVMQHRKMMKPSEIDWRSFHAFPAKTSIMTHGGNRGYNGAPRMEEVGDETMN